MPIVVIELLVAACDVETKLPINITISTYMYVRSFVFFYFSTDFVVYLYTSLIEHDHHSFL